MVKVKLEDKKLVFSFPNRLDTAVVMEIETEVMKKLEEEKKSVKTVVFDLKDVEYISSSFLRLCVNVGRGKEENDLVIINVSPIVFKVFKMAGFDKIFKIELLDWNF